MAYSSKSDDERILCALLLLTRDTELPSSSESDPAESELDLEPIDDDESTPDWDALLRGPARLDWRVSRAGLQSRAVRVTEKMPQVGELTRGENPAAARKAP
jgi:hypothetical protein